MAHNVTHKVEGDELVIRIKVDPAAISSAPPSKSGNTRLVGSSGGFVQAGIFSDKAVAFSISVTAKS